MTNVTIKQTAFHKIAEEKGFSLREIGDRWSLSMRQMTRIANAPRQRDLDAVNGLPPQNESTTKKTKKLD